MRTYYRDFLIRDWQPGDRTVAFELIQSVLKEYGLDSEPVGADQDVLQVEDAYWKTGGEFWVVEYQGHLVGTAGYYPIRKMYLRPEVRGQGLGRQLLQTLEKAIATRGFQEIWVETASVLKEAINLYERNGYQPSLEVETQRCDRAYRKTIEGM
jgi:putative acetyltransferase